MVKGVLYEAYRTHYFKNFLAFGFISVAEFDFDQHFVLKVCFIYDLKTSLFTEFTPLP